MKNRYEYQKIKYLKNQLFKTIQGRIGLYELLFFRYSIVWLLRNFTASHKL